MVQSQKQPVSFFDCLSEIKEKFLSKEIFIFLDYDGTLTPIVATPDLAILNEDIRRSIINLSEKYKVSIVSGRATDDVRKKVNINGLFYAGSHGFEILEPNGQVEIVKKAREIREEIEEVYNKLSLMLKDVEGSLVEDVKYTISVHYRLASDECFPKINQAVENILKEHPNLRKTKGKKVLEIRPKIDWDKGKAVQWILDVLKYDSEKNLAIYLGDDTTDEDAFSMLEDKGFGILVAEEPRLTKAKYWIKNTEEVKQVLDLLVSLKE